MSRLWVKVIAKNRIERHEAAPCAWDERRDALTGIVRRMDLPVPMWLAVHDKEFERYGKTAFLPDHFVEPVEFQRLEIEFLDDADAAKRSRDPRNADSPILLRNLSSDRERGTKS